MDSGLGKVFPSGFPSVAPSCLWKGHGKIQVFSLSDSVVVMGPSPFFPQTHLVEALKARDMSRVKFRFTQVAGEKQPEIQ